MKKDECIQSLQKFEALRSAAGVCFTLPRASMYQSAKKEDPENSWSISIRLYGSKHLYSVADCAAYFEKAKAFFLEAYEGEPRAAIIEKLTF